MNKILWLKGLVAATIGGAVAGVTGSAVAPETINTGDGRTALAIVAGIGAIKAASAYMMQSPRSKWDGKKDRRK